MVCFTQHKIIHCTWGLHYFVVILWPVCDYMLLTSYRKRGRFAGLNFCGFAVYGTCVASQSIMFERSCCCLILKSCRSINLYLPGNCDHGRKYTATTSFLRKFLFTKIYARRGMINVYLRIVLLSFSPQ